MFGVNSKIVVVVLIFVVVAVTGGGALYMFKAVTQKANSNVIAVVGGKDITKDQLDDKIFGLNFNPNQKVDDGTKKQLINELIETEIINQAAARLGVTVSRDEIQKQASANVPGYQTLTAREQTLITRNAEFEVKRDKVKEKVISWREGELANIRFDRHFEINSNGTKDQVAADKKYAQDLANNLYSQVVAGKITFEDLMNQVNNDKYIDIKTYPGRWPAQARKFTKDDYYFSFQAFKQKVAAMAKGDISKPFALQETLSNGKLGDEFSYMIVKVDSAHNGEADSYDAWLSKEKQELNVRTQ